MPDADHWKRKFERAEAGRIEALGKVRDLSLRVINTAADDMQQQVDALERVILNRAALHDIRVDGRKVRFGFVRRGIPYIIEAYAAMDTPVEQWRKDLLE